MSTDVASVADRVEDLLGRLAASGLRQAGRGSLGELEALATSAHAAKLVKVERELAVLATLLGRHLDRDPTFRPQAWWVANHRCWVSIRAARQVFDADEATRQAVMGVHRRKYEARSGPVVVQALAATGWTSDSGFVGITVHLVPVPDPGARCWSASQARPSAVFGEDPRRLLFQPISEVTPLTVHQLAHGAWVLDDVRISADGRLSLHAGLQAHPAPPMPAAATGPFRVTGFDGALARSVDDALALFPQESPAPVVVEIASVGPVVVDDTHARAWCEVVDLAGSVARVVVPLRASNDLLLDNLGRLREQPCAALVGRVSVVGAEVRFEPWTALFDTPVKLGFQRAGRVQEVHLALEPLSDGAARGARAAGGGAPPAASRPPPDTVATGLLQVGRLVEELFGGGLAAVDPEVVDDLADTAAALDDLNPALASTLRDLGASVGGRSAVAALHRVAAHVRLLDSAWSRERVRAAARPQRARSPRRGVDLRLVPFGLEVSAGALLIHALDRADGAPVVVRDPIGLPAIRPLDAPVRSALFQGEVVLREVMAREIVLHDHPVSRLSGRRVIEPAWHTAASSGTPAPNGAIPLVDAPLPGAPCRVRVVARRGPDGWSLAQGRTTLRVEVDELLSFHLDKLAAFDPEPALEVVLVGPRDRQVVVRVGEGFPGVDPAAFRWRWGQLRERATSAEAIAWLEALVGGPRTEPGPDVLAASALAMGEAGPAWLRNHLREVREEVRTDGELPEVAVAWAWGRVLDPVGPPLDALGWPARRWRAAIVGPLARWLRGADEGREVVGALQALAGTAEAVQVVDVSAGRV